MDTVSGSAGAGATETATVPGLTTPPSKTIELSFLTVSNLFSAPVLATVFLLYVVLCSSLRFRKEKAMLRKYKYTGRDSLANMSNDDAQAINQNLMLYEFPKIYMASLQFAIFKVG
jgi:hypothetical protein